MEAARGALTQSSLYPEGTMPALRRALAERWRVPDDWLLIGNGSDEVFRLLAETYTEPGDGVIVPTPSFAGYRLVGDLMGARVIAVPLAGDTMNLRAMARCAAEQKARLLFLCRPNNPTGTVFPEDTFREALDVIPTDTIVVLDEAYREFDTTPFDSRALLDDYPNLVVTRTFSKLYGLAGLRLGYGVMRPDLIAPMLRVRDPFSINVVAAAAGMAALDDREHVERTERLVHEGKLFLTEVFCRLGLPFVPTEANFILMHTPRPAGEMSDELLRRGVLVRPCTSFGLPNSIRVTIGTGEENEVFAAALEAVMTG
jgi:histidinol-phosphate aminotransferase